ncbi:hypothetical protein XELAEV_18021191mg [Xenopus laevis]|uniref:Phorbol-ester/DAG-type domain-containing protein n=1 Tax=Xenopus laevis TaxID=8355 RepID=A0A974HR51_XENLA|nr:hypothetical protein XELAEV_18021191mg [Xenopus laevis]
MSALARAPRPLHVRLGHSSEPPAYASGVTGILPGVRRSRVRSHRPPPDVRYIFQEQQPVVLHNFQAEAAVNAWCDLCVRFIFSEALRCSDCKYTCHSHCKDRVHLSCEPNGKLMECIPANETLDRSNNNDKKRRQGDHPFCSS